MSHAVQQLLEISEAGMGLGEAPRRWATTNTLTPRRFDLRYHRCRSAWIERSGRVYATYRRGPWGADGGPSALDRRQFAAACARAGFPLGTNQPEHQYADGFDGEGNVTVTMVARIDPDLAERSAGGLGEALDRDRRWMEDESLERELDPAVFNLPGKKAKSAVITHMECSLTRLYRYRLDVDYKVRSVETELSESEKRTFCIRAARAGLTVRAYEIEQSIGAIAGRLRDYVMHVYVWLDADEVDRSAGGLGESRLPEETREELSPKLFDFPGHPCRAAQLIRGQTGSDRDRYTTLVLDYGGGWIPSVAEKRRLIQLVKRRKFSPLGLVFTMGTAYIYQDHNAVGRSAGGTGLSESNTSLSRAQLRLFDVPGDPVYPAQYGFIDGPA